MNDVITRFHKIPEERKLVVERIQNVEDIIENNKRLKNTSQKSDWGRHVASIPNVIYERFFNEYNAGRSTPDLNMFGPEFGEFVNRKLHDPDWSYLRTDK